MIYIDYSFTLNFAALLMMLWKLDNLDFINAENQHFSTVRPQAVKMGGKTCHRDRKY